MGTWAPIAVALIMLWIALFAIAAGNEPNGITHTPARRDPRVRKHKGAGSTFGPLSVSCDSTGAFDARHHRR